MQLTAAAFEVERDRLRCLVADPRRPNVEFLRVYLDSETIEVTGTATRGDEALVKIESQKPDVAIVALRMPWLDGLEVARASACVAPGTAILLQAHYGDRTVVAAARDAGVRGVIRAGANPAELRQAIETIAAGGESVDPLLAQPEPPPQPLLTGRELDVLTLAAEGLSNLGIGGRLDVSPETVQVHLANARRKLGAANRAHAVATALRLELIR